MKAFGIALLLSLGAAFRPELFAQDTGGPAPVETVVEPAVDLGTIYRQVVYPDLARRIGLTGKVLVAVLIDENGMPKRTRIEQSAGDLFDREALLAVMKGHYKAALGKDGRPMASWLMIPVRFRLKGEYQDKSDYEQAVYNYSLMMGDTAGRADRYYRRGRLHFQNAHYAEAETDYLTAKKLDPLSPRKYYREEYLERVDTTVRDPQKAGEWIRIGSELYDSYLYTESIESYRKALGLMPDDPAIHDRIARSFRKLGYIDSTIAEYRKVLAFRPLDTASLVSIGWHFYEKEEFDSSVAYSQRVIELDPSNLIARYNLALAYVRRDEFDTARDLYIEAKKINLRHGQAISDGAIGDLKELVDRDIMRSEAQDILEEIFNVKY